MNAPLGKAIGNSLEIIEAVSILRGHGKGSYLYNVCVELASNMVSMAFGDSLEDSKKMVIENLNNGQAYEKFLELVKRQGGDITSLTVSENARVIRSTKSGVIKKIDALKIGMLSCELGAGAKKQGDIIDPTVGIILHKKQGDTVNFGDVLCTIYIGKNKNYPDPYEAFEIETI